MDFFAKMAQMRILALLIFSLLFSTSVFAAKASVSINIALSWDNGTSFTSEKTKTFLCNGDTIKDYGSYTDLWGHAWTVDEVNNIVVDMKLNRKLSPATRADVDHVQLIVYYEVIVSPVINFTFPTPDNDSNVGSSFMVNATVTNDVNISSCNFESNITGSNVNESMQVFNEKSCSIVKKYIENNTAFQYKVYGISVDNKVNFTETRTAMVSSTSPIIALNSPTNNSINKTTWRIMNFTVEDPEEDYMNITAYVNETNILYINGTLNDTFEINYSVPAISSSEEGTYALYRLDNNPDFGEHPGLVFEYSENPRGYNGGVTGTSYNSSGKIGGGHYFEGSDYIRIGLDRDFNDTCDNGCSFTAWVYNTNNDSVGTIISKEDSSPGNYFFKLMQSTGAKLYFSMSTGGSSIDCFVWANVTQAEDRWYHVAGVWNTTEIRVYQDGVLAGNKSCDITLNWGAEFQDTLIGASHLFTPSIGNNWDGILDEVVVWNKSLTQAEIDDMQYLPNSTYFWNVSADDGTGRVYSDTWQFKIGEEVEGITCTYDCSTTSSITSNVDCLGNDLIFENSGEIEVDANITNFNKLTGDGCKVLITNGKRLVGS